MDKQELIELLQAGKVDKFNQFRADNPDVEIDLEDALLYGANLAGANLAGANLSCACLSGVNLICADLKGADIDGAWLDGAIFDNEQIAMLPELLGIKILED